MSIEFCLEKVESIYEWAWIDQALQDLACWATYSGVSWQEEIEAALTIQVFALKALSLGLRVWELL